MFDFEKVVSIGRRKYSILEDNLESNIKKLLAEGVKQTDVAELLGTSQSKVSRVKRKTR